MLVEAHKDAGFYPLPVYTNHARGSTWEYRWIPGNPDKIKRSLASAYQRAGNIPKGKEKGACPGGKIPMDDWLAVQG